MNGEVLTSCSTLTPWFLPRFRPFFHANLLLLQGLSRALERRYRKVPSHGSGSVVCMKLTSFALRLMFCRRNEIRSTSTTSSLDSWDVRSYQCVPLCVYRLSSRYVDAIPLGWIEGKEGRRC